MFRLRFQKIGSLLGLLAILMGTLAPTISQALASHDRLGRALVAYCSAAPENSTVAHEGEWSHPAASHWQACAYCGLLAHVPVLPGSTPVFVAASLIARAPVLATRDEVRVPVAYTAAQPRAPPILS